MSKCRSPSSKPTELTARQQTFVDNFCKSGNATEAATKAGYSANNAKSQGARLLTNANVKAAIATRMEEAHTQNVADTTEILEYLTSVMRGKHEDEIVMNIGKGQGITAAEKVKAKVGAKERLKAAEMLAKVNGLFLNRQELDITNAVTVVINDDI